MSDYKPDADQDELLTQAMVDYDAYCDSTEASAVFNWLWDHTKKQDKRIAELEMNAAVSAGNDVLKNEQRAKDVARIAELENLASEETTRRQREFSKDVDRLHNIILQKRIAKLESRIAHIKRKVVGSPHRGCHPECGCSYTMRLKAWCEEYDPNQDQPRGET